MSYRIQVYTFSSPVPSTSGYPFASQTNISFASAEASDIYLDDAGHAFESTSKTGDTSQALLIDTELGGTLVPAGTVLTMKSNAISVITQAGTGYTYYVFLPFLAGSSAATPEAFGDKTTVMIIPVRTTSPPFDPTLTYNWSRATSSSSMAVSHSEIPPSYLNPTCFATGTMIMTANGPRAVESLRAGDLVLTRDRGLRALAWVGGRHLSERHLDIAPNLRPIRIRAGALGQGLPASDLIVSPQHRVLVRSKIAERLAGQPEALVAARHLCPMPGIEVMNPKGGIGYHHLLFDRHEIVQSNGCWTESLHTGPQALKSVGAAALREIRAIFPGLFQPDSEPRQGAREFLTGPAARELTRRHLKNQKPLVH